MDLFQKIGSAYGGKRVLVTGHTGFKGSWLTLWLKRLGAQLLEHGPKFGCGWNFAPIDMGDVWPVERVVRFICEKWGNGSYEVDSTPQPYEASMLCLDCTKANIELGWRPRYPVARALSETLSWYKEWSVNGDAAHMREYTLRQIEAYVDALPQ